MESNHHGLLREVTGRVENAPYPVLFVIMPFFNGRRGESPPGSHRAARRARPIRASLTQQGGSGAPWASRCYPVAHRISRDGTYALNVPTPSYQAVAGADSKREGSSWK